MVWRGNKDKRKQKEERREKIKDSKFNKWYERIKGEGNIRVFEERIRRK